MLDVLWETIVTSAFSTGFLAGSRTGPVDSPWYCAQAAGEHEAASG